MAYKTRDLNQQNIDVERWNRMDHILRLISNSQMYVTYGDINGDLKAMYQGLQMLLDTITPDFTEKPSAEEIKQKGLKPGIIYRGAATKKFQNYRKILDEANGLSNQSNNSTIQPNIRQQLRNNAYKKLQTLKYALLQECEKLGYNARKTDTTDAYREGNN